MAVLIFLCTAVHSRAEMRCDESLVQRGFNFIEVLERCGPPDAEYRRVSFLAAGVYLPVEEWFYEQGSNRFRRLLTFENGRLVRIELRPKPEVPISELHLP
ncbi:MAG: DUF2845 domain-containing protein [Pseudomonadales bacterium]|nr:DUF2845 domain-containing protein [Pseudomonadales bacterium]